MFLTKNHISRRTLIRGAGVTLALPFLDSMPRSGTASKRLTFSSGRAQTPKLPRLWVLRPSTWPARPATRR